MYHKCNLLLCLVVAFMLAGCGTPSRLQDATLAPAPQATAAPIPAAATPAPAAESATSAVLPSPGAEPTPTSASVENVTKPTMPPDPTGRLAKLPLQLGGETVHAVGVSPQYASDGTVLVSTDSGMLYRSGDAGAHWERQPLAPIERLTFSPNYAADQTIIASYLEVGAAADAKRALRLFQSTDAGKSWASLVFPHQASPYSTHRVIMSTNYAQDRTVFVILHGVSDFSVDGYTFGMLYRSTDAGATWVEVPTPCQIYVLVVSPTYAQDHTLYMGCLAGGRSSSNGLGLHRSVDGGATWLRLQEGAVMHLDLAPTSPEPTLFQGASRSRDGGVSWVQPRQEIGRVQALIISPAFAVNRTLLALTAVGEDNTHLRIVRSVDGGDTWQVVVSLDDLRASAPVLLSAALDAENKLAAFVGMDNALYQVVFS